MTGVRFGTSLTYLTLYVAAVPARAPGGGPGQRPGDVLAVAVGVAALWMLRGTTRDQVNLDLLLLFLGTGMVNLALGNDLGTSSLFALAEPGPGLRRAAAGHRAGSRSEPFTGEVLLRHQHQPSAALRRAELRDRGTG